jgi:HPt (histidine-containing phosphotransfer) domain-containing protein
MALPLVNGTPAILVPWVTVPAGKAEGGMVDWERVATLRAELGEEDFAEVVEMFLTESDDVIGRLRAARPYPTLEAELHFLKGSALNLGFPELATKCSEGEKRATAGQTVDLDAVLGCYVQTRSLFVRGLSDNRAA